MNNKIINGLKFGIAPLLYMLSILYSDAAFPAVDAKKVSQPDKLYYVDQFSITTTRSAACDAYVNSSFGSMFYGSVSGEMCNIYMMGYYSGAIYISNMSCEYAAASNEPMFIQAAHNLCTFKYSCPPDQTKNPNTTDYTVLSDLAGTPSASGAFCSKPLTCYAPYFQVGNKCMTYCQKGDTFNKKAGLCEKEEDNQCHGPNVPYEAGNPVIINSGEKIQTEQPDLQFAGTFPLVFTRTYYSQGAPEARAVSTNAIYENTKNVVDAGFDNVLVGYEQPAGYTGPSINVSWLTLNQNSVPDPSSGKNVFVAGQKQWRNNFQYALISNDDGSMDVVNPNNSVEHFTLSSGNTYTSTKSSPSLLVRLKDSNGATTAWILRDDSNMRYRFETTGLLSRIINPSGQTHWLSYNEKRYLTKVRDNFNNSFTFTYLNSTDGVFIDTITSSSGAKVQYQYDSFGNLKLVTKTTSDGKTTTRQYHYENGKFPYALTGITDERNVRYATWDYNNQGRAILSTHADGAEKTTFAYTLSADASGALAVDTTTVTNALNKSDVYHYAQVAGARRLVSVEGQASTSCLAANKQYTYDEQGRLKTKTDWNGNTTEFEYNDRGLVTKQTEAKGKPEQRVTETVWHNTLPLPIKITQGSRVETFTYDAQGQLKSHQIGQ